MPRGDRTGPAGMGPQTGRAAGFCAGSDVPGFMTGGGFGRGQGGFGRGQGGFGRGQGGFGRGQGGFGRRFRAGRLPGWPPSGGWTASPEAEKETLEQEARALESSLEQIRRQIAEIDKDKDSSSK